MNVKCEKCGQLFNDEKFDTCPHCTSEPAPEPVKEPEPEPEAEQPEE